MRCIHFARNGELLGEYPEDGVRGLIAAGAVHPSDYYWHDGMSEWMQIGAGWNLDPAAPAPLPETGAQRHEAARMPQAVLVA